MRVSCTNCQFEEQSLDEIVIFSQNLEDFLVAGQVDQNCQGIFSNGLCLSAVQCGGGIIQGRAHSVIAG